MGKTIEEYEASESDDEAARLKEIMQSMTPLEQLLFDEHTEGRSVVVEGSPEAHVVRLTIGNQSFDIGEYRETYVEAEWMRAMLAKALGTLYTQAYSTAARRYREGARVVFDKSVEHAPSEST